MFEKLILVGRLGHDPEMRYTPAGVAVTNFSLASNRKYTNSDGNQVEETLWVRVTTWGKLAENCNQYLEKGRQVLIEGQLNPDPATGGPKIFTRRDGSPGAAYEATAKQVVFLAGRENDTAAVPDQPSQTQESEPPF